MDTNAKKLIKTCRETVDQLAGPGIWVVTHDGMPEKEKKSKLFRGFLEEGLSPDDAQEKAREFLELAKLAAPSKTLPS